MKYIPENTLAYYNAAPQFHRFDLSGYPVSVFSESSKAYKEAVTSKPSPNEEALKFYCLNHLASIVKREFSPSEVLPDWARVVMKQYLGVVEAQGLRMMHYLLLVTTREMRHLQTGGISDKVWAGMVEKCGDSFKAFILAICGPSEDAATNKYLNSPPECTIGQFTTGMAYGFNVPYWQSSFGGIMWGQIAEAVMNFIHGVTSTALMLDAGYALRHNNAPMFDKSDVKIYSGQNASQLDVILDVQRSGQIPELVLDPDTKGIPIPLTLKDTVSLVRQALPTEFRGGVDWDLVNKWGAKNPKKETPKKSPEPKVTPSFHLVGGKKAKVVGEWKVFPEVPGKKAAEVATKLERVETTK